MTLAYNLTIIFVLLVFAAIFWMVILVIRNLRAATLIKDKQDSINAFLKPYGSKFYVLRDEQDPFNTYKYRYTLVPDHDRPPEVKTGLKAFEFWRGLTAARDCKKGSSNGYFELLYKCAQADVRYLRQQAAKHEFYQPRSKD